MPLFSIVGGLAVFAWSRRLYGTWGGLLSLTLWVFCPNILAHARLITSDLGSTALGVAATYVFWRYLQQPSWRWAAAAGVMLGLAQLTKFSMLLLYAVWPFLWLVRLVLVDPESGRWPAILARSGHGLVIVVLSVADDRRGLFLRGSGDSARRVRVRLEVADAAGDAGHEASAQQEPAARRDLAIPGQSVSRNLAGPGFRVRCPSIMSWASTNKRSRPREYPSDSSSRQQSRRGRARPARSRKSRRSRNLADEARRAIPST